MLPLLFTHTSQHEPLQVRQRTVSYIPPDRRGIRRTPFRCNGRSRQDLSHLLLHFLANSFSPAAPKPSSIRLSRFPLSSLQHSRQFMKFSIYRRLLFSKCKNIPAGNLSVRFRLMYSLFHRVFLSISKYIRFYSK